MRVLANVEFYIFKGATRIENKTVGDRYYRYVYYPECLMIHRFVPFYHNLFDRYPLVAIFRPKKK
jgi:hypothetical protein